MSEGLPDWIAPISLSDAGKELKGSLDVAEMSRVAPLLYGGHQPVQVDLSFGIDIAGIRFLAGSLRGEVTVTCQRCLQRVALPLDIKISLGIVRDLEHGDRLPKNYEPMIVSSKPVRLADVIEEELLLYLPSVPMHDQTESCVPQRPIVEKSSETNKQNPFADLAKLKQKL